MRFAYKRPLCRPDTRRLVQIVPYISVALFLFNCFMQVRRMILAQGAEGQSIPGYAAVSLSLVMWLAFYRVATPEQSGAFWTTALALVANTAVASVALWFRTT